MAVTLNRTRDAALTRSRILAAAVDLFAKYSYDEVGLRQIVGAAGVSLAMVKRYFGSKAGLFAEVIDSREVTASLRFLGGNRDEVAERIARLVTDIDSDDERRRAHLLSLMVMLRATHCESAVSILRNKLEQRELRPLAKWLGGAHSAERAALMEAFVMGLATMQRVMKVDALTSGDMDAIVHYAKSVLQLCIKGRPGDTLDNFPKRVMTRKQRGRSERSLGQGGCK